MQTYRIVERELRKLPDNTALSKEYCNRWSGILNVDGKYVKVRGYEKKIPFIYAIDYLTHDIPVGILASAENSDAYRHLFSLLQSIHYPLKMVVCDDSASLRNGLIWAYPDVPVQMCQTHYLENLRQGLEIRTADKYHGFFGGLLEVFERGRPFKERMFLLQVLEEKYGQLDLVIKPICQDVRDRYAELFAYEKFPQPSPHSNNIIEAFNSHLNGRLETIKGFKSFETARLWLNGWMVRRRLKPFTDCQAPFKHLNGKCSLEMSIQNGKKLPKLY